MRRYWPKHWSPPHVIAWRLIWIVPVIVSGGLFLVLTAIMHGPRSQECRDIWNLM